MKEEKLEDKSAGSCEWNIWTGKVNVQAAYSGWNSKPPCLWVEKCTSACTRIGGGGGQWSQWFPTPFALTFENPLQSLLQIFQDFQEIGARLQWEKEGGSHVPLYLQGIGSHLHQSIIGLGLEWITIPTMLQKQDQSKFQESRKSC